MVYVKIQKVYNLTLIKLFERYKNLYFRIFDYLQNT